MQFVHVLAVALAQGSWLLIQKPVAQPVLHNAYKFIVVQDNRFGCFKLSFTCHCKWNQVKIWMVQVKLGIVLRP